MIIAGHAHMRRRRFHDTSGGTPRGADFYYVAATACEDWYCGIGDVTGEARAAYACADWRASGITPTSSDSTFYAGASWSVTNRFWTPSGSA
jgi:hypothetical protein